ncbi:mRNA export factor [Halotydeus destructor]|nr:mRNA export factor [Halotydeus destructor]
MATFGFGSTSTNSVFGGTTAAPAFGGSVFGQSTLTATPNPMKDVEVVSAPDDSISSLAFSPQSLQQNFLVAGSWDNQIRLWEVGQQGQNQWTTVPKAQQTHTGPVLDVAWSDDGSKVFTASCDKTVKMWDLGSNQAVQVAAHDAPVKTVHWIKGNSYNCVMTGSWDKTLKFWDTRSQAPILTLALPERAYCADVVYPMAVVGTAGRQLIVYSLDSGPQQFKVMESPLKYQHRCVSIFTDKKQVNPQPCGFAVGSVEGRVAIQYVNTANPRDNFTFKCHRSSETGGTQDIFAVNDIAFHPHHGTLATVGSDGRFSFWDKDARTKLKNSELMDQPITKCGFSARGELFAYAVSYDWSKGHEYYSPQKKNYIFLHPCYEEMRPRNNKK